ncbi:MAG: Fic family protein [Pseudarcicella sp.]|nr:Fic family protein [Pseudarcicella sp.]MBP6410279.1 Fic family protein [Pseudarcicella sp.]
MFEQAPKVEKNERIMSLVVDFQMNESLQRIQDEYLYWDKIKYKTKDCTALELWSAVKMFRFLRRKEVKFHSHKFYYVITDYIQKELHQFDMLMVGTFRDNIGISGSDKTKFIIGSIMEEAIFSSQIEGASTTRKKAKEMIHQEKKPKNKSEQMILNNYNTMKYIVENKDEDLTVENLLYIHKLITNNTFEGNEEEGKFRQNDEVYVVNHANIEVVYTPPLKSELVKLINDLCVFFNHDNEGFIHPVVKGCIVHFMIGWIHPFTDGNGRTARALFYWYMLKKGYWITEYLSISRIIKDSKSQYEKAYLYTEIDENDMTYFLSYHVKVIEKAFIALKEYLEFKQKEVFYASKFIKIEGVNERMAQVLKILYDDSERILNVKEIEARFNVSNYTARSDLKSLVELGFLEVIQVNKQKQNFVRSSIFESTLKNSLSK